MILKRESMDMTTGSIWRHLIAFALPLVIGQLFQRLYSTVDSVVVGRFVSSQALAAIGSTGNIIEALICLFSGMATGAGVVISQYYGAKDYQGVRETVHTAVLVTCIMGVLCMVLGMLFADTALRLMDTPDDVFADAAAYLRIYFGGVLGLMLYNIGSGILQAVGDSRRPLYFLIFSAVTNVVLDLLFVLQFHMGVEGVAYATIISEFLSAILTFVVLARSTECYRVSLRQLRIYRRPLRPVLRIGVPAGLQQGIVAFSNVFVQAYINAFQSACMAGWASYNRLDSFAWVPMICIGMASTTFTGQNIGAGNIRRTKDGVRIALLLSVISTVAVIIPLMLFAKQALSLFNTDPEVLEYGRTFVLCCSPFYVPYCFFLICSGAVRGAGDSIRPMIISIFSFVVFRQCYLFIGTKFIHSPVFVGLSYPAGWVVSAILMYALYKSGKWERELSKNIAV